MTYYDTFELPCGCRWRCKGHEGARPRYVATLAGKKGWGVMDTKDLKILKKTFRTKEKAEGHAQRLGTP